jgi:CubicO group peptidase (beta-lactamase class C family)
VVAAGRLTYRPETHAVDADTVYDLASLTKSLSTAVLTMMILERTWLDMDTTLDQLLPLAVPEDKKPITLLHLLSHTSGLPAWRRPGR